MSVVLVLHCKAVIGASRKTGKGGMVGGSWKAANRNWTDLRLRLLRRPSALRPEAAGHSYQCVAHCSSTTY